MYEQKVRTLGLEELKKMYESNAKFVLVDARSREDFDQAHLPGALSIPVEDIKERSGRFDKREEIVTYCGSFQCQASTAAAREFMKLGFKNVKDYKGGIKEWTEKGYPTETVDTCK